MKRAEMMNRVGRGISCRPVYRRYLRYHVGATRGLGFMGFLMGQTIIKMS